MTGRVFPSHHLNPDPLSVNVLPLQVKGECSEIEALQGLNPRQKPKTMLLLLMLFSSQQISASILHLYGQTLASGSEGGKPPQKTKKLFLGNEAEKLAPDEARRRLRKLVGQISLYLLSGCRRGDGPRTNKLTLARINVWFRVHLNTWRRNIDSHQIFTVRSMHLLFRWRRWTRTRTSS